ncbi:MAG TPA: hypothetical protein VF981_06645 [Gemmatimonadaceae bacterium]
MRTSSPAGTRHCRRILPGVLLLVTGVLAPQLVAAQARTKPLLSREIRAAYTSGGAAAAEKRYQEIVERESGDYQFDLKGMMGVGTEYAKAGDMTAAQVFLAIAGEMSTAESRRSPAVQQIAKMLDSADRVDSADRAKQAAEPGPEDRSRTPVDLGPTRQDLARFAGVYGDPAQQRNPRNFFVIPDCDGRLKFGAMWGDVSPWTLRSTGDRTFVQARMNSGETEPFRLEFHVGAGGNATAVTHTFTFGAGPVRVPRLHDLPAAWEAECKQTRGPLR